MKPQLQVTMWTKKEMHLNLCTFKFTTGAWVCWHKQCFGHQVQYFSQNLEMDKKKVLTLGPECLHNS
jgi:hypothetical protein